MSESKNLHVVIIWLYGHPGTTQFVFSSRDSALVAFTGIADSINFNRDAAISLTDDFGRTFSCPLRKIDACQMTDITTELNGQAEVAIIQAHANVNLQKRASRDPMLGGAPVLLQPNGPAPSPTPFPRR